MGKVLMYLPETYIQIFHHSTQIVCRHFSKKIQFREKMSEFRTCVILQKDRQKDRTENRGSSRVRN